MTGFWACMLKPFDYVFMTKQESDLHHDSPCAFA